MATHSSILAWKIPWTEEPGRPLSVGSQIGRQDLATENAHGPHGTDCTAKRGGRLWEGRGSNHDTYRQVVENSRKSMISGTWDQERGTVPTNIRTGWGVSSRGCWEIGPGYMDDERSQPARLSFSLSFFFFLVVMTGCGYLCRRRCKGLFWGFSGTWE